MYLEEKVYNYHKRNFTQKEIIKKLNITKSFYKKSIEKFKKLPKQNDLNAEFNFVDSLTELEKNIILCLKMKKDLLSKLQDIFECPHAAWIKDIMKGEIW